MNLANPAITAFNSIAKSYDAIFSESVIGRAQRAAVWETTDRVFRPSQRILEVNCGTGMDALHLAERGVRVHACDGSSAMVEVARERMRKFADRTVVEVRAIEQLGELRNQFDGLLSNFGGLNCVADLYAFIAHLERLINVGGSVVICYMGAFCAWETAWYLLRGEPKKAVRRWKRHDVPARLSDGTEFLIHYPTVRELKLAFGPKFRLREWKGIGACVPPSYMERVAAAHEEAINVAARVDKYVAAWPVMRSIADHVLLRFERTAL